jgi:thioredoxin 1
MINNLKGNFVYFGAGWCIPCHKMRPILEELENKHNIPIVRVDIEEEPEMINPFNLLSVPTLLYVEDKELGRLVGFHTLSEIERKFNLV